MYGHGFGVYIAAFFQVGVKLHGEFFPEEQHTVGSGFAAFPQAAVVLDFVEHPVALFFEQVEGVTAFGYGQPDRTVGVYRNTQVFDVFSDDFDGDALIDHLFGCAVVTGSRHTDYYAAIDDKTD